VGLPGGVVAHLQIPAIHLDQFVVEGVGENDLRRGPGHYPGSSQLGRPGNAAIAGHRTTYGAPFNRIGDLKPGDVILATTAQGTFLYAVAGKQTVSPGQTTVVDDYGDNRLTLTTCTPEFSATDRLIVVAALEGPAPAAVPSRVAPPAALASRPSSPTGVASKQLRREPQGFDGGALPLVLLCGSLLVALGFAYRPVRARLPVVASMAVLAPLWFGGLLMLFEQVNRFLPPNV
jgi:sortase A